MWAISPQGTSWRVSWEALLLRGMWAAIGRGLWEIRNPGWSWGVQAEWTWVLMFLLVGKWGWTVWRETSRGQENTIVAWERNGYELFLAYSERYWGCRVAQLCPPWMSEAASCVIRKKNKRSRLLSGYKKIQPECYEEGMRNISCQGTEESWWVCLAERQLSCKRQLTLWEYPTYAD